MKKISLIALMLATLLNIHAADFNNDGLYYNILSLSDLTVELAAPGNGYYSGDITVPRTVEYMSRTFNVTSINSTAFKGCNINTLTITDGIKEVGELSFGNVTNLRIEDSDIQLTINYSYSYEGIWEGNIEHVYMGRKIISKIEEDFFDDRVNLFGSGSGVQSIEFGPKVTGIPEELCSECSTLTSVTIPANVKIIGDYAFVSTSLSDFNAPGVTSVGTGAFRDCKKLKRAEFSQSLNTIEGYAFHNCTSLEDFVISEDSHNLRVIDYHAFEGCTSLKSFVIPEGVCYLGYFAFFGCTNLETVKIPNSVFDFGNITGEYDNQIGNVFKGCSALKTIILGHRIPVKIWENSFGVSTYLSATLKVPAGTKEKYQSADYWKNFLTIEEDATINDNICTIAINRYQDKEMMDDVDMDFDGKVTTEVAGSLGEWNNHNRSEQNLIVAPRGGQIKITLMPRDNYRLTSLTVNGEDVTSSVVRNVYTMDFTDNMELTIVPTSEYYRYKTIDTNEATFKEQDDGGFAVTDIADDVTEFEIPATIVDGNNMEHTVNAIENSAFENNTNITSVCNLHSRPCLCRLHVSYGNICLQ